jgi:hypothetical protein
MICLACQQSAFIFFAFFSGVSIAESGDANREIVAEN